MSQRTLKRRLYALLVRWFLIFLALAALSLAVSFARYRETAIDERLVLARALARQIDVSISDLFHTLQQIAEEPLIGEGKAIERLRSCRFQHIFRDAIYVLDGESNVVLADPSAIEPLPASEIRRHESVTPLLVKDGTRTPFVALVQPFRVDRARYSLVAEMHLPGSLVGAMLGDVSNGTDLRLAVIDDRGAILAASEQGRLEAPVPEAEELGRRIRAHRAYVDPDTVCWSCGEGETRAFATVMAPLEYAPWGVVLQQPREQVFAAVYAARYTFLATLTLLTVIGLFLSWVLARTVIAPIGELSQQAERLRQGDLSRPIAVRGDHELQVLARSMDEARDKLRHTLADLRRLNESLEEQVAERTAETEDLLRQTLDQDAQRRVLVRRLLEAGEEERKRIARELHDEISQLLAIVQLSLESVPAGGAELRKASTLLVRAQEELHRLIYDLRPSLLDDLGLPAAVRWYAENYLAPRGLDVHLEIDEALGLPPEIETTLFRIYQEIVTNLLRHARAESVSIELYAAEGRLKLAVEDDGVGFAVGAASDGVGIVGMRERAEIVGGTLRIDSEPGMGTHVVVELPLEAS